MTQGREAAPSEVDIEPEPSPLKYWEIARWLSTNSGGGDSRKSIQALGLNIAGRSKDGKHYLVICPLGWKEERRGYITLFIDELGNPRIRQYNGIWPVIDIIRGNN